MQDKNPHRYDDMLDMPHHQSQTRAHMSLHDRAAQFAPFRALSGYEESIEEAARLVDDRISLHEDKIQALNERLVSLKNRIREVPYAEITYFKQDSRKNGGAYVVESGNIKQIDSYERVILFTNGKSVKIDDILDINEGDINESIFGE